jgi:hypothetical protein
VSGYLCRIAAQGRRLTTVRVHLRSSFPRFNIVALETAVHHVQFSPKRLRGGGPVGLHSGDPICT